MSKSGPTLKTCPRCRLAMQASRSGQKGGYDTFTCLRCDLVLTYKSGGRETETREADPD